MAKKPKSGSCEWVDPKRPCRNTGRVEVPWSGLFSNRTEPPKLCTAHASVYAHQLLEARLDLHGKWAFELVVREIAEEVYYEQRREEDYDG
jgi:hypothetical protein